MNGLQYELPELAFFNAVEDFCSLSMIQEPFYLEGIEAQVNCLTSQFNAFQSSVRYDKALNLPPFQSNIVPSQSSTVVRYDAAAAANLMLIKKVEIDEFSIEVARAAAMEGKRCVDEFIAKTTRQRRKGGYSFNKFIYFFINWKAKKFAIKKLEFIKEDMGELLKTLKIKKQVDVEQYAWRIAHERQQTSSDLPPHDDVVGRQEDIQVIQEMLMMMKSEDDDNAGRRLRVISVVGIPGIGKTTIARKIYNSDRIKSHFGFLAWVSYGGLEIIRMGQNKEAFTHGDKKWAIYDLLRNQRYLIVIDDFVTLEHWNDAKEVLLSCDTLDGNRILLTTRNERLALDAIRDDAGRSPSPYLLRPLSDVQSWELFTKKVIPSSIPLNLVPIGNEIVKKCHGLPIAIEHLSDYLSKKNANYGEWLKVLQTANKQLDNQYLLTPWSYLVEIIVNFLPLNLKQCLFYFGFFPINFTVPVRRLIALWLAEGFVEPKDNKNLECTAETYLQELIDLNMIQVAKRRSDGRPKRCCLVHYLHEHLLARVKQPNYSASFDSSTTRTIREAHRLADHRLADHHLGDGIAMPSPDSYKSLWSFLSFDYRDGSAPGEQIRNFLYGGITKGCFQLLRVLDLEGVYKPGLPKELGRLIHLRYLGLRWTYLDTLPSFIGNFINLQTLDVKHTYINIVPNSIWELRKLRHLYLNESHLDSFVHRPSVGYLENLQTLLGIFVDEESPLKQGLDRFTKVTRLGVSCYLTSTYQYDAMAKWISKLDGLQSLRLRSKDRLGNLSNIKLLPFRNHGYLYDLNLLGRLEKIFQVDEFPPNLTELTLSASKLEEDPMPTLGRLSNLSILRLYSDSYIGKYMLCPSSGFMQLQVLEIWKLKNLETWTVEEGTMQVLKKLEIRSCEKLEILPIQVQQITTLQELKLTDMPTRFNEKVKEDSDKDWYKRAGVHFVDWNGRSSSVVQSSSSSSSSASSCSCFGRLILLFLLLEKLPGSTTKHARVNGVPALTYRR